ncbi:hypothetical protein ACQPZZ_00055 [Microbispora sp. CA-135349]|uniref:hypothetical protein n=1 Tax=Microbispora sp. CA-135349 TaxID=3239953 RepID=UPI003D8C577F
MDDNDAPLNGGSTGHPEAASISSTLSAESPSADDNVARLGEQILNDFGDVHTNNTLTRWLAHHTAALIAAADQATAAGEPDAAARAADARAAILQLWDHRSAWPVGWPPPRAVKIVQLFDDLPDLNDPRWHRTPALTRLHDLHHHILAALVDLATLGGENLEQGWLDAFGDRLTPDEVLLLTRAAAAEQRLKRLNHWMERILEPDNDARDAESPADGTDDAEAALARPHPLAALADVYRQTVLDFLYRARDRSSSYADDSADGETDGTLAK